MGPWLVRHDELQVAGPGCAPGRPSELPGSAGSQTSSSVVGDGVGGRRRAGPADLDAGRVHLLAHPTFWPRHRGGTE